MALLLQFLAQPHRRSHQTVASFNSYLVTLEAQLDEEYTPKQLRGHLWCKLHPDIRYKLSSMQEIPATRTAIVHHATRIENSKRRATGSTKDTEANKTPRTNSTYLRRGNYRGSSHPYDSSRTNVSDPNNIPVRVEVQGSASLPASDRRETPTCYHCGKKGHIKPHCPELNAAVHTLDLQESDEEGNGHALQ